LGYFGEFFDFWDILKILYIFIFFTLKKMFEKKSEKKTISRVNYGPLGFFRFTIVKYILT
jgi:hypothetical protein